MAMRLSGLMSGMDTDSIVQELVAVRRTKVDAQVKAQTKLEWKQEAWKELNNKLKNLQSKYISNMRFSASYAKKTSKVSDESAVSVITGEGAVNAVQEMTVNKLAKTAYLTGGEVKGADGKSVTAMTKISDMVYGDKGDQKFTGTSTISLTQGGKTTDIKITEDTTISDVLNQLKDAGLNASFDAKNMRFFISAKESGEKADFNLNAYDENGVKALQALGLQVGMSGESTAKAEYKKYADYIVTAADGSIDRDASIAKMADWIASETEKGVNAYLADYKKLLEDRDATQKKIDELNEKYKGEDGNSTLLSVSEYETAITDKQAAIDAKKAEIEGATDEEAKAKAEADLATLEEELTDLNTRKADAEKLDEYNTTLTELEGKITAGAANVNVTEVKDDKGNVTGYEVTATDVLTVSKTTEAEDACFAKAEFAQGIINGSATVGTASAVKVDGQNAEITLNGATFTNTNNVFAINGLTITALAKTDENKPITITTQDDVDGIYDMVKDFLKEYNSLINEMDKLYNADSAKGFEPLTDEEKEALSESEIEKYEKKIKDALLRRDSNLNSVADVMKSAMSGGYSVNGKTMYLTDFGINTLGYFTAADNEKNAYYIDGDPDSAQTSGNADKLKSMISSNPDTVISFFTALSNKLYDSMSNLSRSVNGYRSFGNFYDDKKLKSDYTDYTSKIAKLEQKLADYEDSWYAKFSAMESAMSKMQNNANAVASLLGGL